MNESDAKRAAMTRLNYPPGTRLVLDHMNDNMHPVPDGTWGTVQSVDDGGNVLMLWDNGRTLSLVPEVDRFHKLTAKDIEQRTPAVREEIQGFMKFTESSLIYPFALTFDQLSEEQIQAMVKHCAGVTETETIYEAIRAVVGFNPKLSDNEYVERVLTEHQELATPSKPPAEEMEESQGGMQWQM